MDAYATHIPLIARCFLQTDGPVLELGCGEYSTLLLHELCQNTGRPLVTIDCDKDWMDRFTDLSLEGMFTHEFICVGMTEEFKKTGQAQIQDHKVWAECKRIDQNPWGLVFIDHRPGERRKDDILRLKDRAQVIVVHDSQEPGYGYEPIFAKFTHRFDYKRFEHWTTALWQESLYRHSPVSN